MGNYQYEYMQWWFSTFMESLRTGCTAELAIQNADAMLRAANTNWPDWPEKNGMRDEADGTEQGETFIVE